MLTIAETEPAARVNFAATVILMSAVAAVRCVVVSLSGMPNAPTGFLDPVTLLFFALVGSLLCYAKYRRMRAFEVPARAMLLGLLLLTYLPESNEAVMHLARQIPYADDALSRADVAIGFDWLAYLRWLDAHPLLWEVCRLAYWSIWDQMLAVAVVLMLLRSHARLCTFFGAQAVCLASACVFAAAFPAVGAYVHYDAARFVFGHAMEDTVSFHMVPTLEWVRASSWAPAPPHLYHGVVSFPSYHAMCCVTCAWALWTVRWLRWPACALNLAMFAAIPVQGAHYLVDLIAGVAIAGASIVAVGAMVRSERVAAFPSHLARWYGRPLRPTGP